MNQTNLRESNNNGFQSIMGISSRFKMDAQPVPLN